MTDLTAIECLSGASVLKLHSLDQNPLGSKVVLPAPGQASGDDPAIVCLRPREWLWIDTAGTERPALQAGLREAVNPARSVVLDLSDGLRLLRVSGPASAWLLAKLGGIDFCGDLGRRYATMTRLGDAAVLVHHHETAATGPLFDLLVDRSLAKYLDGMLNASLAHAGELAGQHGEFR